MTKEKSFHVQFQSHQNRWKNARDWTGKTVEFKKHDEALSYGSLWSGGRKWRVQWVRGWKA